jgi:hypothetical protein
MEGQQGSRLRQQEEAHRLTDKEAAQFACRDIIRRDGPNRAQADGWKGLTEAGASCLCPCNIHKEERHKAFPVRIQLPSRHILRKSQEKEAFEEHTLILHRTAPTLPCGAAHAHNNGQPVGTLDTGYSEMGKV